MITITRKLEFDYGHRVLGHEGKCKHLHGHRGVAEITVSAAELDGIGRVIDFGKVKELVGGWIDYHWDHTLLLNPKDPQATYLSDTEPKPPYLMLEGNPTAENMAKELFRVCQALLPREIKIEKIRLWETPNSYADYQEIQ